jgi:predicted alpha/beta-fold hydrolase
MCCLLTVSAEWKDVDAYYAGSSSAKRIPAVRIPLLCIQALDDPIAPAEAIPCDAIQDNPNCMLAGEAHFFSFSFDDF